jgi:hypothetical protein
MLTLEQIKAYRAKEKAKATPKSNKNGCLCCDRTFTPKGNGAAGVMCRVCRIDMGYKS